MKKGGRIIFDSGSGYEIGYFEQMVAGDAPECVIEYRSGVAYGSKGIVWISEVKPHTNKLVKELTAKYGYEKSF